MLLPQEARPLSLWSPGAPAGGLLPVSLTLGKVFQEECVL